MDTKKLIKSVVAKVEQNKAQTANTQARNTGIMDSYSNVDYNNLFNARNEVQAKPQSATSFTPTAQPSTLDRVGNYIAPQPDKVRAIDFVREVPETLSTGIGKISGGIVGLVGGAVGAATGLITGNADQVMEMYEGKRKVGDYDSKRLWDSVVKNAKSTAELGTGIGEGVPGLPAATVIYPAMVGIGIYKQWQEIGKVYQDYKNSGKDNAGLNATYDGLKKGGSEGWKLIGADQALADKVADTDWGAAIGNFFLYGSAFLIAKGAVKKAPAIEQKAKTTFKNLTKDTLIKYDVPDKIYISPEKVKSIFQTGDKITPEELDMYKSLGLNGTQARQAIKNGVTIEADVQKVVSLVDKPYWGKVKNIFGFKPTDTVITTEVIGRRANLGEAKRIAGPTTAPIVPVTPAATALPEAPALPAGVSAKPVIPTTNSQQIGFQIVNQKKQQELVKAKKTLQEALADKRAIVESGKTDAKTRASYEQMGKAIKAIEDKIAILESKRIKTSGPVVTPEQRAAAIQRVQQPEKSQVTVEQVGKELLPLPENTIPISREKLKVVNKIQPKRFIKKEKIKAVKEKPVSLSKTETRETAKKPTYREERIIKREARESLSRSKAVEEAKALEIVKQETARRAREKNYKQILEESEKKKQTTKVKQEEKVAEKETIAEGFYKNDPIRARVLENKIKQELKAGRITEEQAKELRKNGKIDLAKGTVHLKKSKTSIDMAEDLGTLNVDENFKLFEHGYRLVKKYMKRYAPGGVFSERNLPRGAKGAAYPGGTILSKSRNDVITLAHEITHVVDRATGFYKKITDTNIKNSLIDIFKKYYFEEPITKISVSETEAMVEGFATFIERYAAQPTATAKEFPNLVKEFLKEGGMYYEPVFNEIIDDFHSLIKQYKALKPLSKTKARIADKKSNIESESFYNIRDKVEAFFTNAGWMLEKAENFAGDVARTVNSPRLWLERNRGVGRIFQHNLFSKKGRFSEETFLALDKDGNYVPTHNFNWGTIIKGLNTEANLSDFGAALFARHSYFDYLRVEDGLKKVKDLDLKITELKKEYDATLDKKIKDDIKSLTKEKKELEENTNNLKEILENNDYPFELAEETYLSINDRFNNEFKQFDALVKETANALLLARIITPEQYKYYTEVNKGYAPNNREIINELTDATAGITDLGSKDFNIRGTKIKSLIARTGGKQVIKNPFLQAMVSQLAVMKAVTKQITYNKLADFADRLPDFLIKEIPYSPTMKDAGNTMITIDSGYKRKAYQIDPELRKMFDFYFTPKTMGLFRKLIIMPSKFFVSSTTGSFLAFPIYNMPLDAPGIYLQTKNNVIPIYDSLRYAIEAIKKDSEANKYATIYFEQMGFSQTEIANILKLEDVNSILKKVGSIKTMSVPDALNKVIDVFSYLGMFSEALGRVTEFIASMKNGNPQIVALRDAATVATPFSDRGYIYPWIQPAVYANSLLQATSRNIKTYYKMKQDAAGARDSKDKTNHLKRFAYLTAAVLAIQLYEIFKVYNNVENAKTPEEKEKAIQAIHYYNNLSIYERSNYLQSSAGSEDVKRIRTASGYTLFPTLITMAVAEKFLKSNYTPGEYASMAVQAVPASLNPTAYLPYALIKGLLLAYGMKDWPTIAPLEPDYMKKMPSNERKYSSTNALAVWLGNTEIAKALGYSPIRIEKAANDFLGRGITTQLLGKWDETRNPVQNVIDSLVSTFTITKKESLFTGREFDKFYTDREKVGWEATEKKDLYTTVRDSMLLPDAKSLDNKNKIYTKVSDLMSSLRDINDAKIEIPIEYKNSISSAVEDLNRGNVDGAKKTVVGLLTSRDFNNFMGNTLRLLKENEIKSIKEKYDKSKQQSRLDALLGIEAANAAENTFIGPRMERRYAGPTMDEIEQVKDKNIPIPKVSRTPVTATMWGSGIKRKVTPQYAKNLSLKEMEKNTEARATYYNPTDPNQTRPNATGIVNGVKIKYGHVASSRRDIPKGTKIYVNELKKIFVVQDRLNGGYSEIKGYNHFDFAVDKGSREEKLIAKTPTITFRIIK